MKVKRRRTNGRVPLIREFIFDHFSQRLSSSYLILMWFYVEEDLKLLDAEAAVQPQIAWVLFLA